MEESSLRLGVRALELVKESRVNKQCRALSGVLLEEHKRLIKPDEEGGEVVEGKHETLLLYHGNPYLCTVFEG